jgi:hypothetical protein
MAKPYPWFFAVNDRPVVVVATPSGAADCLVFDFVSGNLIPDRSYLSETTSEGAEELTQPEWARLMAERRVDVLAIWAERLCQAKSGSAEDLLTAIGASMKPAPLGATEIRVRGGEVGQAHVELILPPGTIAKDILDERFGESRALQHDIIRYDVTQLGAPCSCSIFASFTESPQPRSTVKTITLRLEPNS